MREVPFVPKADDLALATSHLVQSSSASRFTAGADGFFPSASLATAPIANSSLSLQLQTPRNRTIAALPKCGGKKRVAYFARFHTSSAFPPPDAAMLVYFISSPVIVTDRF
jgi:hypothetical protein